MSPPSPEGQAARLIAAIDARERGRECDLADVVIARTIAQALDTAGLLATPAALTRATAADLIAELVRRGVLAEDDGGACDTDARTHSVNCSCFGGARRLRRYVTEWEPIEEDA